MDKIASRFPRKRFILRSHILMICFILIAFVTYAKTILAQRINLVMKNVKIETVLHNIDKQYNINMIYEKNILNNLEKVDVEFKDASIKDVLHQLFNETSIQYTINDNFVVLSLKNKPNISTTRTVIQNSVSGKVTDKEKFPLISVTITNNRTKKSVATNQNGEFSIEANIGDNLIFRSVGYSNQTIRVSDYNALTITLESDNKDIDEVVVTALGIKKSTRALTYNVQEISAKDVNLVKDANFINSLAGRVAGATINTSSAGIGGSVRVVLRGVKSISQNNNALYVIDGIPLPNLFTSQPSSMYEGTNASGDGISHINPEDIESMTVMTGASASALYGSDAANGVVLLTMKKGNIGKPSVSLSNSTGFYTPFIMPQFQNTYGQRDPFSYYSWGEKLAEPSSYSPRNFFQSSYTSSTGASIGLGSETSQTYFSAAYLSGKGILPNNEMERYNFSLRQSSTIIPEKLKLNINASYVRQNDQNMLAQGLTLNPLIPAYLFPPGDDIEKYKIYKRYDQERGFKTQFWPYGDLGYQIQNPYWLANEITYSNNLERYMFSGSLSYNINKNLEIITRANYDNMNKVPESKYGASTSTLYASDDGYYSRVDEKTRFFYSDIIMKGDYNWGKYNLVTNVGASLKDEQYVGHGFGGNLQTVPDKFIFENIINNSTVSGPIQNAPYHDQTQSIFGTSTLGFDNKAFLEVTARNDWPSQLAGASKKSFLYYSTGISGIISDMITMPEAISYLKLRGSYSEVGNAPPRYITKAGASIIDGIISTASLRPSSEIQPERTKSIEVGLNTRFFNSKLALDVTGYYSQTFNQLFQAELPPSSGYNGFWVNAGRVDNKGLETTVTYTAPITNDLKLTSVGIFTINRNKVVKMLENHYDPVLDQYFSSDSINMGGTMSYYTVVKKGGTMGDIYVNTLVQDEHGFIAIPGGNNPVIRNDNSYIHVGNSFPKYYASLRNSIQYKNFEFNFMVDARVGGVGVSSTQAILDAFGVSANSGARRDIASGGGAGISIYRPPAALPAEHYYRITGGSSGIGSLYTYSLTNARLREAALSYTFNSLFNNTVKNVALSVTGRNLIMFYSKTPFDPELTASTGTYYQGIDYFMQPSLRNIGFSVKCNF